MNASGTREWGNARMDYNLLWLSMLEVGKGLNMVEDIKLIEIAALRRYQWG